MRYFWLGGRRKKKDLQSFECSEWRLRLLWQPKSFSDKDPEERDLCLRAFEVTMKLVEAANLAATKAQPHHADYGY